MPIFNINHSIIRTLCLCTLLAISVVTIVQATHDAETFTCADNSKVIQPLMFNDNYCDCQDGSDETRTSACAGLTGGIKFYCKNSNHIEEYIHTSKVNDGVCDCCDGSDEINLDSGISICDNTCIALSSIHRLEEYRRLEQQIAGSELREQLISKAKQNIDLIQTNKQGMMVDIVAVEVQISTEENALKLAEEEAAALNDANPQIDSDLVDLLKLNQLNMKQLQSVVINLARRIGNKEGGPLVQELIQEQLCGDEDKCEFDDEEDVEQIDVFIVDFSIDSPEIKERKDIIVDLNSKLSQLQSELDSLNDVLNCDYGIENEFYYMLEDECYKEDLNGYTWEICPFGKATQIDHSHGSTRNSIGNWNNFKNNDYKTLLFTNGATCWNGPNRSLELTLECGPETKLIRLEEPSRCVYTGLMQSPAICTKIINDTK